MIGLVAAIALAAQATPAAPLLLDRKADERPRLMIVGSAHLANNNRDIANIHIDDVTTPERQREINTLVASLARYKPTRIAIEWPSRDQAGLDKRYADYRAGRLKVTSNERDQVALRLAALLGLAQVDAIDWNEDPPGKEADYDFVTWAAAHGQSDRVEQLRKRGQADADATAARMRCTSVTDWFRALNTPEARERFNRIYYDYAVIGDEQAAPGATWVGNWYTRNLRIFGQLVRTAQPTDRILVLYGAGHSYLLDQDARQSGAFTLTDPLPFLPAHHPRC
ncbi:MAG: DUF5694 domain-containing protein [Sphingomonas sp.]